MNPSLGFVALVTAVIWVAIIAAELDQRLRGYPFLLSQAMHHEVLIFILFFAWVAFIIGIGVGYRWAA